RWGPSGVRPRSLLVAALVAGLAKELAVLLLGHALATLLDDRTHRCLCSAGPGPAGWYADPECAARGYFADGRQLLCRSAAGLRAPTPRSASHLTCFRPILVRRRMRDRSQ